jgi:hypothetical protein
MAITLGANNSTDNGSTASATVVVTLTGVSTGDLIVAEVSFSSNATLNQVKDNVNSGNYTAAVAVHHNTTLGQYYGIYYMPNSASGTVTITLTVNSSFDFAAMSCQAWHGALTTGVLDSAFSQQQDATSTANPTTGSVRTPAGNGELIIAACGFASATPAAGANYALIGSNTQTLWFPEYWIQSSSTATNGPFTASSDNWTDQMAAFIPAVAPVLTFEDDSFNVILPGPVEPIISVW